MLKKELGEKGEKIARFYLERKGYVFIEKNFRVYESEIDVIMHDPLRDELVFIEVKTRSSERNFYLDETISFSKMQKIRRGIEIFCKKRGLYDVFVRIDAAVVLIQGKKVRIQHFQNIDN